MADEFNLPGSSFEEVQKIIKGYAHAADNASLDDIAKLTGLHTTIVSRNNKFLADVGLIEGGMKKSATELGRKLGRALDHGQKDDCLKYWREAVQTNEKVSGLITTVRIRGGMSERDFSDHVLYVSGQKNNSGNKTGARCVVDVLLSASLLKETDGKLSIAAPPPIAPPTPVIEGTSTGEDSPAPLGAGLQSAPSSTPVPQVAIAAASAMLVPQVAINIQLQLPETENAEVYEKLFKALREQLLGPKA